MEQLLPYLHLFDVDFSAVPKANYSGVIVESREHPMLELVLKNFVYMLPDWSLTIFHCCKNENFIINILGPNHTAKLVRLSSPDLDIQGYNELLTSEWFYDQIEADKILIFQCDAFIRKGNIKDFLRYDYVGAPWIGVSLEVAGKKYTTQVGNGGLSLRDKETMLRIIRLPELQPHLGRVNEDVFFSIGTLLVSCNRCSPGIAGSFSSETFFHPDSFGWHKGYFHRDWDVLKTILVDFKAYYGIGNSYHDVTQLLLARERDGVIELKDPYNSLFGDPSRHKPKYLRIESKIPINIKEDTKITIARRISPPNVTQIEGTDKIGYLVMALLPDLDSLRYGDNLYKRNRSAFLVSKPSLGLELVVRDSLSNDKGIGDT